MDRSKDSDQVITTICHDHCTSACVLKMHVRNGVITRIETDDGDEPQYRACLKGRAYRHYIYHPDRLKYPLRRVGERGEEKFERVSWDEALGTIASQIRRVKDVYGAQSTLFICSAGDVGWLHNGALIDKVLVRLGGYTGVLGTVSSEGTWFAAMSTYGVHQSATVSSKDTLLKTRLLVLWGWNPVVTRNYGHMHRYLREMKDAGIRAVSIDPRYNETAALLDAQWIPIRPGTDAAMAIAMAYVIITENLQDQAFLDKYTVGFDKFRDYVLGKDDSIPKTPAWAEAITEVPSATIASLAREYATTHPAALMDSLAPARTAYGEQFCRATATLAAMTGNVGVAGGSAGTGQHNNSARPSANLGPFVGQMMKGWDNPVHLAAPLRKGSVFYQRRSKAGGNLSSALFYTGGPTTAYLNRVQLADAIIRGKSGGYPADYKLLYMVTINYLNQYGNSNRIVEALKKLEFIVVQEQFMTATARFADIILPTNTIAERNDVTAAHFAPFYGCMNKAIDPIGESKSQFEIACGLAAKLGITDFTDKTEEQWLREVVGKGKDAPDYNTFKKRGIHKIAAPPVVAFQKQISDPAANPFPTPSGKIEIYSKDLADFNSPKYPPVPGYIETWEGRNDPLAKKYPLQMVSTHYWRRTHSKFEHIPWLTELEAQSVTINTADALSRGIKNGDMVKVFNDRGRTVLRAKVTERIMPGVVDIPEGGEFRPDENGIDRGGCANVLTRDEPSPGGAFCSNTALVQIERASP